MSDTKQSIVFTELISKAANKSYNNFHWLESYTENFATRSK